MPDFPSWRVVVRKLLVHTLVLTTRSLLWSIVELRRAPRVINSWIVPHRVSTPCCNVVLQYSSVSRPAQT